ncbi:MAG TPA: DUF1801 domain-containing protein [Candidatus Limnocylindrales bacterium]|nr:DUF1801 domain-containing protein [Candidatus Limnocylindrales bacterium]
MDPIPPEALLADHSPEHRALANALRDIVRRAVPDAIERVRPGWGLIGYDVPVGRRTRYFAWIWPEPEHVHLGFEHGVLMDDPQRLLKGRGVTKKVRWLTFQHLDEIPSEAPELVREAVRVATMSRMERELRRMDLEEAVPSD